MKTITCDYIKSQYEYILPKAFLPNLRVEVFNEKKKTYSISKYQIKIVLIKKPLKTDKTIRITKD